MFNQFKRHRFVRMLIVAGTLFAIPISLKSDNGAKVGSAAFLRFINSARANGAGGCVANLVDEQSGIYNPGAMGLFHLDHYFAASLPNNTKYYAFSDNSLRLNTWGASGGTSFGLMKPNAKREYNLGIGLAYYKMKLDYGILFITDYDNPVLEQRMHSWDEADHFVVGLGFEYKKTLRVGIGYTHKEISNLFEMLDSAESEHPRNLDFNAHDYGIIAEFYLHELVPHKIGIIGHEDYFLNFRIVPSFAFVKANIIDGSSDETRGLSLDLRLNVNESSLFSIRILDEKQQHLNQYTGKVKKNGYEFGFLGIFTFRTGTQEVYYQTDTYGFGFSFKGITSWLRTLGKLHPGDNLLGRLIQNLDITYDYAKYYGLAYEFRANATKSFKFNLSF